MRDWSPVMGLPLMLLFLVWLAGRIAMFVGGNPVLVTIIDCLFLISGAGFAWREVMAGGDWVKRPGRLL